MTRLIVIRIVPDKPVSAQNPTDFTSYLSALGGLQITAYDLSFNSPTTGQQVGSPAVYIAPTGVPSPTSAQPDPFPSLPATYAAGTGIVQQIDLQPSVALESAYYTFESVATAVIEIMPSPAIGSFVNLRLVAQWGTGAGAQAIPIASNYYKVAFADSSDPTVATNFADLNNWSKLPPSLYLSLPTPPSTSNPLSLQVPTDGTPPPFNDLLPAVQHVLTVDPGPAITAPTIAPALLGSTVLSFASTTTAGITAGMAVSGTGIPNGTIVTAVASGSVTLSQQVSTNGVANGETITFTAVLGTLSVDQCRNIAYEILWSQSPPLPTPPNSDPIADLYTDGPNTGSLLSSTSPNQYEGDRQQFEAQLKSYYATTNANADRLTNYVYALSAAVACEQQSLAATQVLLEFPVNPGQSSSAPSSETELILTGIGNVVPTPPPAAPPAIPVTNFGVPAAYFYALASSLPTAIDVQKRYTLATSDQLQDVLKQLTSAINVQTIADTESYITVTGQITAAQAARRIVALGIPNGTTTPLAPLDTVQLLTSSSTPLGITLPFSSTTGVNPGMMVSGTYIAVGTTVSSVTANSVTLSAPILGTVPTGSAIVFTPAYSTELQQLIISWLAFPPPVSGVVSSQSYQPGDDFTTLWTEVASTHAQPGAFLSLVLSSLTQGYIIPAPFNVALGDKITQYLATVSAPPTVATLAAVTASQWTALFKLNPTWLPPQLGNTTTRIAAFIQMVQKFFTVASSGPISSIDLATSADTPSGTVLPFASTTGVQVGMTVSSPYPPPATLATNANTPNGTVLPFTSTTGVEVGMIVSSTPATSVIPSGTAVMSKTPTTVTLSKAVSADVPSGTNITFTPNFSVISSGTTVVSKTPTTVTLSKAVSADVPSNTNITFTPNLSSPASSGSPASFRLLPFDAITQAVLLYSGTGTSGTFVFGSGSLDDSKLTNAVQGVFIDDKAAQAWLKQAFTTINELSQIVQALVIPAPSTTAPASLGFSIMEALYASGFLSAADITALSISDFPQAVIGTVAFDVAAAIYTAARNISPPASATTVTGAGFQPINSDGSLTNCIPPLCLSPLGPVAYLSEMLQVSELSTCEQPLNPTSTNTLGTVLATRRGPLGNLAASGANVATPILMIDIVNESLEFMGASATPTGGTVYDTSAEQLAGFVLCREEPCSPEDEDSRCHDPATIYGALPEHSTPASPNSANAAVVPLVYNKLKVDFSSCHLPYSQALDVNRTYLRHFRSCRYEEMRIFRKCITEFVLDPNNEPVGFQDYLWRYPVRIDTAIEYLGITAEEYQLLFQGSPSRPCAERDNRNSGTVAPTNSPVAVLTTTTTPQVWQLYGFASPGDNSWTSVVLQLPEFLRRTCLTYCEFVELWKSDFVSFGNRSDEKDGAFPVCEPCCLDKLALQFPREQPLEQGLLKLAVFIRLWHKLKELCCARYSFDQLRDICDVLQLFKGASLNPDFIRQLAAFQMLRDDFRLELVDPAEKIPASAVDADRTHLLALWVQPQATKWHWAVRQLVARIEHYACRQHHCDRRSAEFVEFLAANLDPLSKLAGFDPTSATDNWHALPTHTLRFAEVLAKLYASRFKVEEVLYLFTADSQFEWESPFPQQDSNEALVLPLDLPDDQHRHSLWQLRRKLLEAWVTDEDVEAWSWKRVESELQTVFGFSNDDVLAIGEHFFPCVLKHAGYHVDATATRFFSSLPQADTTPQTWNTPPDGPFQYDPNAGQLWTALPLTDTAVLAKLAGGHDLAPAEQTAVQDLYFQPRALLAKFALLFPNFASAEKHMIEAHSEEERWAYFRRHFALCHLRCRIIAEHLTEHVAHATGEPCPEGNAPALLILRTLLADENKLVSVPNSPPPSWENNDGTYPAVTWTPLPIGGAFAALLALVGTGLVGEYKLEGGAVVWRDVCGPLSAFGWERNRQNCPVPTVLPAMNATIPPAQSAFVSAHNGLLQKDLSNTWLGGAQGFDVTWSGALLIDHEGPYEFWAGAPTPDGEEPDYDAAENRKWSVTLSRGSRTWTLLSHNWPNQEDRRFASVRLRRGAYDLTIELAQPTPNFLSADQVRPQHTGLQVKYAGPDSHDERVEIPHNRLFSLFKDKPLGDSIANLSPGATAFLSQLYVASLCDIRRTYQRAFKALLFVHRFELSAGHRLEELSELGYMLAHKVNFAGAGFYRQSSGFTLHQADFDFNYLPVQDNFHPPTPAQDQRVQPSPQRIQAMFHWWEGIFDYTVIRNDVQHRCDLRLWHLFNEAATKQPADPSYLLRQIGADEQHWRLDLRYYQEQGVPIYTVNSTDLEDDRWVGRAWHADQWLQRLQHFFAAKDIAKARPDLWASDDPGAIVAGESETGNANLLAFLCESTFENGDPRRYEDVRRLNDGLRVRGRDALLAYLCNSNRVALPWQPNLYATLPRELSGLLLLDVEVSVCEKASRIDEAITAVQSFVRRARLGLEPGWKISREFAQMWDREFVTFDIWQACKRRHLYKENWLEWSELDKARRVEAFRFLETKLKSAALTDALPGGLNSWPDEHLPIHQGLELVQQHEPTEMQVLATPREGLNLIGTPGYDARPTWLTAVAPYVAPQQPNAPSPSSSQASPHAAVSQSSGDPSTNLPFWMQTAIRLGTHFYRIAAAGVPSAAMSFEPHKGHQEGCVSCCDECGCEHPAVMDEYYFWLIDGRYYDNPNLPSGLTPSETDDGYQFGFQDDFYDATQQQATYWEDPTQLPQLLAWEPLPMVRLAWCRVHNSVFQQPRRSHLGVPIQTGNVSDLSFEGRTADSLFFTVSNAVVPQGYADTSPPGFRYDLATDSALVLPLVTASPSPPSFVGGLPAYPYFVYTSPGTHLFPLSPFCPSLAIARWLRTHCRFEAALKWYRWDFDLLQQDCTWVHCVTDRDPTPTTNPPTDGTGASHGSISPQETTVNQPPRQVVNPQSACCDSADVSCAKAEQRAVILHYLETLREWGHIVMRRGNSPEAFQQARVIFDAARLILGKRPASILLQEPATPVKVSGFKPEVVPLNPRLLNLYDNVEDQLSLIHDCLSARRLHNGRTNWEMPYFGNTPLREGWRTNIEPCMDESEWCYLPSPYRFTFLIQKAMEYASKVQELGGALLAAFEKGDAEYLAAMRAGHEAELLTLGLDAKKDQWRNADWQIESLQKTKAVSQANLIYYNNLIQNGLIANETGYQDITGVSIGLRAASNIIEAISEASNSAGNFFTGVAGFGGSPLIYYQLPIGEPLGSGFAAGARIINGLAEIANSTAGLLLTEAGWDRRSDEWIHQTQILTIEIQQIERQILALQRSRNQMLVDLNSHRRQIEQSAEVQNFLRDKFSSHDLYLFLQKEAASLYYQTYDLALYAARQAERAFNLERGHTTRHFIPEGIWDNLHEGLMAGERLSTALRHMEKTYLDENIREYELTKHFSLRLNFPIEFLHLRTTGHCEIDIPEWMFDQDFPGQYMRRITNVTLTLPCVTGPYTGVHCRLTLISSITRIDPRLSAPAHDCCCPPKPQCCGGERSPDPYQLCPDDPRMVKIYGAREAIATSGGQNDSGMFELSFSDPRYLPFEYMGAVSRWCIELPPENNYFDPNTLTDAILHLNYTAREGGEVLRSAAIASARHKLPGDGWSFFDLRHDFPDAWERFRHSHRKEHPIRELTVRISRNLLPFLPRDPEIRITRFVLLFETDEMLDRSCPETDACRCPERKVSASHIVKFNTHHDQDRNCEEKSFTCYAASEWPRFYSGTIDTNLHPFCKGGKVYDIAFGFPNQLGEIVRAYLFCHYETVDECC